MTTRREEPGRHRLAGNRRIAFAPASRAKATLGTITPDTDQATRYWVTTAGQENGQALLPGQWELGLAGLAT